MRSKEIIESPVTELGDEAAEQFAQDMEEVSYLAHRVAEAVRTHDKKHWKEIWEEYWYAANKMQRAVMQYRD